MIEVPVWLALAWAGFYLVLLGGIFWASMKIGRLEEEMRQKERRWRQAWGEVNPPGSPTP